MGRTYKPKDASYDRTVDGEFTMHTGTRRHGSTLVTSGVTYGPNDTLIMMVSEVHSPSGRVSVTMSKETTVAADGEEAEEMVNEMRYYGWK